MALVTISIKEGYGVLLAFNVMQILDKIGESGSVHQQRQRPHIRHQRLLHVVEMGPELRTIRSHLHVIPKLQSSYIKKLIQNNKNQEVAY